MSLPASIFTKLSTDGSATSALLGVSTDCRVYPGQAPDKMAMPFVVMTMVSSNPETTHDASSDFDLSDIQFSIVAGTYSEAWAIRKAIRSDLSDVVLDGGEKPVEFNERDGFSEAIDAHALILEASIWHNPIS